MNSGCAGGVLSDRDGRLRVKHAWHFYCVLCRHNGFALIKLAFSQRAFLDG